MVHNYLERISTYSSSTLPIEFFAYIAGGFGKTIDKQIKAEVIESNVHGACITVFNFIKMVENHQNGTQYYNHRDIRNIFSLDRQVNIGDIYQHNQNSINYDGQSHDLGIAAESSAKYVE